MSSKQGQVRDALRAAWRALVSEALPEALAVSQEDVAAKEVLQILWPVLRPDDVVRLDRGDQDFLLRGPAIPENFDVVLAETLFRCAMVCLRPAHADNRYARGTKLRQLVAREIQAHQAYIRAEANRLFEAKKTDRFASPTTVREQVLGRLSGLVMDELLGLDGGDETEAKRRLKILTALATLGSTPGQRATRLRKIQSGHTADFPYVLKFLSRRTWPSVRFFPVGLDCTLLGFHPTLESRFPEAVHVRICLDRYMRQEGVITRFIDPDGPVVPSLESLYDSKPDLLVRPQTGLVVPKSAALAQHRRDWLRMPDGVVCAVSLSVLLESVLRQTVFALALGGGANAKGGDLLSSVSPAVPLQIETVELLGVVFDQRSLNLRDAMAHGAFFASDSERLEATLAGLSQALKCLIEDLVATGMDAKVFGAPRWDARRTLDADISAIAHQQYRPDRNLALRLLPQGRWARAWHLMERLTPDKLDMARVASLLWVSGQEDAKRSRGDDTHHFATIHACLITVEELFRAVYEIHGRRVLRVQRENADRVRCELSILDSQPGQLLDPASLSLVFGKWYEDEEFRRVLDAVRAVRDQVLHGAWHALQDPLYLYSHLIAAMIYALCDVVGFDSSHETTSAT
jgi:hypothetical protein